MKYHFRLAKKKYVIDWYNMQTDSVKAACFIEQDLGANYESSVHLCVNGETKRKIIFRIGRRGLDWFNTSAIPSQYMNVVYYKIESVK
jgi:hypothetical protein